MSRRKFSSWLAAAASLGVCLGMAATCQAQVGGVGLPRPGGGVGVGQPGVGVGVGVGVGPVNVDVNVGVGGVGGAGLYQGVGSIGQFSTAQQNVVYRPLEKWYYYPYYYFPHNYWPQMGPKWPENPGEPTLPPPAYMAYPPFREPHWRYEAFEPQKYYKGFHFWLDQF